MRLRTLSLIVAIGSTPISSFGQGAGSWASGSDVFALLLVIIAVPVVCILAFVSAFSLLARPYLLLIPIAAGIVYLKVWPADVCIGYNPCPGRLQTMGFLTGFVPTSILVWLIARIALPRGSSSGNDAT